MSAFVRRTCTVVPSHVAEDGRVSGPIESFREHEAYVLLGPPGAGKTEAFKREAAEEAGQYVSARDFLALEPQPGWRNTTLYIDGLDETRAGAADGRTPFDGIRAKLQRLGSPRFRLSCREADWFGANDRERLTAVAPGGEVLVLSLDPLPYKEILALMGNLGLENPTEFLAEAEERGLGSLLSSPQDLTMLVKAVVGNAWPRSRKETFSVACRLLVAEENPEHQLASSGTADVDELLDAAGALFALLLLTGNPGFTLPGTPGHANHPAIDQLPGLDQRLARQVSRTRLFQSVSEGHLVPAHRQVAEFLAGMHLAGLISDGLPPGRVLSLVTGFDGGILSSFRGLAAWLAAHSNPIRHEITQRDPLGTLLYGDVRDFSAREKEEVFDGLIDEARKDPWLSRSPHLDSRARHLVVVELQDRFRRPIASPPVSVVDAEIGRLVVRMLGAGKPPVEFEKELHSLIRCSTWPASVRYAALDICIELAALDDTDVNALVPLLDAVYRDVDDRVTSNQLTGHLLDSLYPSTLTVQQLLGYLRHPLSAPLRDLYRDFWLDGFAGRSTPDQLLELLSALRKRIEACRHPWPPGPHGADFPEELPGRCLNALLESSDAVRPSVLYYWIALTDTIPVQMPDTLVTWLTKRPALRDELVDLARQDEDRWAAARVVDVAVAAGYRGLGLPSHPKRLRYRTKTHRASADPSFQSVVAEPRPNQYGKPSIDREHFVVLRDRCREHLVALRENRGPPELLHDLAQAYLGGFAGLSAPTGRERLAEMLGDNGELVGATLQALGEAINRVDLPTHEELSVLASQDRRHLLAHPILAGLRTRESGDHVRSADLDDRQARIAVTLWHGTGEPPRARPISAPPAQHAEFAVVPEWLTALLRSRPELVADALVGLSRILLRAGVSPKRGYHDLVHRRGHRALARLATLRLLEAFPARCGSMLLRDLRDLLVAACCHCPGPPLVKLIEKKLRYKSLDIGQRVHWLAAGSLLAPEKHSDPLDSFVTGHEGRMRHLKAMVVDHGGLPLRLRETWDVPVLAPLIRVLARWSRPTPEVQAGVTYTPDMEVATFVSELIGRLARIPNEGSGTALANLVEDRSLQHWSTKLSAAGHRQVALRRDAQYRHADLGQVSKVLANRTPANAADLWALTTDRLQDCARDIRDGATSAWRQFWNVDHHDRPMEPRPENACRAALLLLLRGAVAHQGVEAVPEGYYADDKRADIRVSCDAGRLNVPIEIKKSCHRELWSAVRTQLTAKYVRDPGAEGHGIYLVFWFGETDACRPTPPPAGPKPRSATELQASLLDTLSDAERRKISVCVVDVSPPSS